MEGTVQERVTLSVEDSIKKGKVWTSGWSIPVQNFVKHPPPPPTRLSRMCMVGKVFTSLVAHNCQSLTGFP